MNEQVSQQGRGGTTLEADMVCAACATVNPPGTLLCQNCGHNLRDQMHERLNMEAALPLEDEGESRSRLLYGLLTVLGLLVLVYVAIFSSSIAESLYAVQSDRVGGELWEGRAAAVFEPLAELVEAAPRQLSALAPEEGAVAAGGPMEGWFLLMRVTPYGTRPIGIAMTKKEDAKLIFVARLNGGGEVRGTATVTNNNADTDTLVFRNDNLYVDGYGYAQPSQQGGYLLAGFADIYETPFELLAYPISAP